MNEREEARGRERNERDRESNINRDFYPGGHGFDDMRERARRSEHASYGRGEWRQRAPWPAERPAPWSNERGGWNERGRSRGASSQFPRDLYGREHSSEQLFDRAPFGRAEDTQYFGTGAADRGGPGFTGGAYAYGDGPREPRHMEEEYSDESAVSYEHSPGPQSFYRDRGDRGYPAYRGYPSRSSTPRGYEQQARQYPRGPKGYQRSDERLKEDICERLMEAYHIDSSEVTVEVKGGGKVSLDGSVPTRHMKHAIEDIVDACPGVTDIENRVRVGIAVTTPAVNTSVTPPKTR